jgi:DNA primase
VIPAGFLQDLISRVDIVEVVGRHVELKRAGANFVGLCPFHAEKSPSFSVTPSKQFYYCFGCGAAGDAIKFLTEHHGMSFFDAVEDLAQRVGMQVPQEQVSAEERERRQKLTERRLSINDVLQRAADFYRTQLRTSPVAIEYLKKRGLDGAIAARFGLGYAPEGWRTLAGVFPRYDDPLLEEAGLVRVQDEGEAESSNAEKKRYDWFRHRVMFPIRSVQGEVIGFGGRVLDDSKPKYMNSPETPVFSKGRELYGLFEARQAIRERGHALVVEGYMDVVALAQNGFGNAVATLGTACTADHVQKLFRFTDAVVFSFDGDAAGRRAAGRALEASLPHVGDLRSVRFLFLPTEHDPDSFVRELGAEAFEAHIKAAVPLSRQLIEHAADGANTRTPEGRARMLANAKPLWLQIADSAYKRQLLAELAREAELGVDELGHQWQPQTTAAPMRRAGPPMPLRATTGGHQRRTPASPADQALRLLLSHSQWWEQLSADDHQLLHELEGEHGQMVAWLEQQLTENGSMTWAALDDALADSPLRAHARRWVDAAVADDELTLVALHRVLHRLWRNHHEQRIKALIAEGNTDRTTLDRIAECNRQIRQHRDAEVQLSES